MLFYYLEFLVDEMGNTILGGPMNVSRLFAFYLVGVRTFMY